MPMTGGAALWTGRVFSGLVALVFLMSGFMKLRGGPELDQGMSHLEIPGSLIVPIAILEIACAVVYLIPRASVLGAVLLTGYMGGAILTHLRVGDPVYGQVVLGLAVWLGPYLREKRLKAVLPLRTPTPQP